MSRHQIRFMLGVTVLGLIVGLGYLFLIAKKGDLLAKTFANFCKRQKKLNSYIR